MNRLSKRFWDRFQSLGRYLVHGFVAPTRRLVALTLLGAALIAPGVALGAGFMAFWVYNGFLAILSLIDIWLLPGAESIRVGRRMPESVDVLQPFKVTLEVTNDSGQPLFFALRDDLPMEFKGVPPLLGRAGGRFESADYETAAGERGRYRFSWVHLRYWGRMGLWAKQRRVALEQEIKVLPDLSAVRGYLSSPQQSLILGGRRLRRRVLTGTEFHGIRDYFPDDDARYINWNASARAGRIMTNVYQPERGKNVTILLDCGRMMGVELDGQVKLDRTIEAALIMAAVALRQEDQVSVLAFSDRVKAWVPPGRRTSHLHEILEAVYDLKSDFTESNYRMALEHIGRYQKKRSFLVLFSDMESYLFEDQLIPYLTRLGRVHLPLLLSLKDPQLLRWTGLELANSRQAYVKSIARRFEQDRREYAQRVSRLGINLIDVPADEFALAAVNFYLEVRSREAL
ncbi:MAG: DUF58 domain-containing protein [Firmicutes bacterium]|nr:DUF58 domain-containing protein [Bacillota bacterium]